MAKKKKRSEQKKKNPDYIIDLMGIGLILFSILGLGKYGPIGRLISSFAVFLVGSLYVFLLIAIMMVGIYTMVKKEKFNFFSSKLIGLYIFLIGILVFLHQNFVLINIDTSKILIETIDYLMLGIENIMDKQVQTGMFSHNLANTGGGLLGGIFSTLFFKLFDKEGTTVVVWVFLISGFMIFSGMSIIDIIKNTYNKSKTLVKPKKEKEVKEEKVKIIDHNELVVEKEKILVQDINDLKINQEPVKDIEEKNIKEVQEEKQTFKPYVLPPLNILDNPTKNKKVNDKAVIEKNSKLLESVLNDFGIIGKVVEVNIGPTVVQYEVQLNQGTKVSKLLGIDREIALALAKKEVRIQAPIPGKTTVGIEMPNEEGQTVFLKESIEAIPSTVTSKLAVGLGKNIMGKVAYFEVDKTPHLLVAGATGSGKSVCINTIIISILMRAKPNEVKLMLIDPKKVELSNYNGIPHLLRPVVTDPKQASNALKKIVSMMDTRYSIFEDNKTKNIASYNKLVDEKNKTLKDDEKLKKMPYIVVIIDELADLMLVAAKEVEDSIMRITQMARAAGIHLIVATQRPSTDVITGLIKANIPSRIAFSVSSSIDSRTILDMKGAEKLLGKGDMLFLPMGENVPIRIQGAFVKDDEIKRVIDYTIDQQKASYDGNFLNLDEKEVEEVKEKIEEKEEYDDPLYNDVVEFVITQGKASTSLLQRKFKLGYNRAARIIDLLEERGIIGPQNGSKPREVLIELENKEE